MYTLLSVYIHLLLNKNAQEDDYKIICNVPQCKPTHSTKFQNLLYNKKLMSLKPNVNNNINKSPLIQK